MGKGTCTIDGCERHASVKGMCGAHYQRERARLRNRCSEAGCDNLHQSRGLCSEHLALYKMDPEPDTRAARKRSCAVETCEASARSRGWCNFHYRRWVLAGDPEGAPPSQQRKAVAQAATSKVCKKCNRELPMDEFSPRSTMIDGRRSECRECIRGYHKARHANDIAARPPRQPPPRVPCKFDACTGFAHSRGWCKGHYERWRRNGSPEPLRILRPNRTEEQYAAEEKTCSTCKRAQSIDAFHDRSDSPDGKSYICRQCVGERNAKVRERTATSQEFRDKRAAYSKKYRQAYREDMAERQRASKLWINYGITLDEYEALYRAQGGVCKICGGGPEDDPEQARKQWLAVDHCHESGRIRGLLCGNCNVGLGNFRDDPNLLNTAMAYLSGAALE